MKLVWKTTLLLLVGMCFALAAYVYVGIRAHLADYRADLQSDQDVMSRAVTAAVAAVWAEEGQKHAQQIIKRANEREQKVEIGWLEAAQLQDPNPTHQVLIAARQALQNPEVPVFLRLPGNGAPMAYTYRAVVVDGVAHGVVEIAEHLTAERTIIRRRIVRSLITGAAMTLIAVILSVVVGSRYVGVPIRELIVMARKVGYGDFAARVEPKRGDEIAELGHEMNMMALRLAEAAAQVRHVDRLTTVGKLASGVAHELGTPLHVIAGRAKRIASEPGVSEKVATSAATIVAQAEKITTIIRQLLDFSRGPSLRRTTLDLSTVVVETSTLLAPIAYKKGVTLEVSNPLAKLVGSADPIQIQQVLTNLVINAVHASPAGSKVMLGAEPIQHTANEGVHPPAAYARLFVSDQGQGIAPEVLPHIFEPFFTTKDVGEGTGLGLSVAHGIVREHKGWIDVQTAVGGGSCFSVYLPMESA